jgi:YbgC/YbaW family acyl-CoA thioester hydrolase
LKRDDCTFWIEVDVRWSDMDSQRHVNNAVYFTYCEQVRIDFLNKVGIRGKFGAEQGPMLVSASCDFKRQVVYPAKLDVGLLIDEMGRSSGYTLPRNPRGRVKTLQIRNGFHASQAAATQRIRALSVAF